MKSFPQTFGFVVHPDVIVDQSLWQSLGSRLVLENMDERKPGGRTEREMADILEAFPEAGFCLDLAHSRQIDPTMSLTVAVLRAWSDKVVQIHMSELSSDCKHRSMSIGAVWAFEKVASLLPDAPVIQESVIGADQIAEEVEPARQILAGSRTLAVAGQESCCRNRQTGLHHQDSKIIKVHQEEAGGTDWDGKGDTIAWPWLPQVLFGSGVVSVLDMDCPFSSL